MATITADIKYRKLTLKGLQKSLKKQRKLKVSQRKRNHKEETGVNCVFCKGHIVIIVNYVETLATDMLGSRCFDTTEVRKCMCWRCGLMYDEKIVSRRAKK